MNKFFLIVFCLFTSLVLAEANSEDSKPSVISWGDFPSLPDKYGFAGGYAGIVGGGNDRWLVFGGGANFPYANPFDEALNANNGQPKVWYDTLYAIQLEESGLNHKGEWKKLDIKLPTTLGYGGSVSIKSEEKAGYALFIGGDTGKGQMSDAVLRLEVDSGKFSITEVAKLPTPVGYMAAQEIGGKVYVVSGKASDGAVPQAWGIDTASWKVSEIGWPQYEKGVAAKPRSFSTLGTQGGKLYLIGGRQQVAPTAERGDDSVKLNDSIQLDFYRDCYSYDPKSEQWSRIADLPRGISAAPSNAVPSGATHLVLLGGGSAENLRKVLNPVLQQELDLTTGGQGFNHPGFNSEILAYHSITNTWAKIASFPDGKKVPVTAPVVIDGDAVTGYQYAIISGEWSPKLRDPGVQSGTLKTTGAKFGVINWIVVVVYLLGMVGIGYWFMKKESAASTDDYFRGGQRIPWWVAGLSIFATVLSSITFMAIPAVAYSDNWNRWVGQWPIFVIIPLVVFFYLPFFRKLNLTSAYEYLEARFNLAVRLIASAAFMIFHVGRIAIVLYLPALALSSVSDINIVFAIVVIGVLCIIYTVMGGIEAVVWTDAIQALVLIFGALLCFGLVIFNVDGGLSAITDAFANDDKFLTTDWSFDAAKDWSSGTSSGWLFFFGFLFAGLPSYTAGQDVVQRYVTTPSEKEAARSLWLNIVMTIVGSAIFFGLGTALYVFYQANPASLDPTLTKTDAILPFFIMQNLPIGVSGLIVAGVFAAAQSTISSSLNSLSTSFVTDYYGRVIAPNSTDQKRLSVARNVVIIIGIIGVIFSVMIAKGGMQSAFDEFNKFVGLVMGPLAAMFALGIFTKRVGGKACLIGALVGFVAVLNKGRMIDANVWGLFNGLISFGVTFIAAYILSFILPANPEKVKGLSIHCK